MRANRTSLTTFSRCCHRIAVLAALVLAMLASAILLPAAAGAEDKLPLPRFASLQSGEVNMRAGPGETYPILWTYQRAGLPVEIIEEFDIWRRIRDHDGVVGWVKSTLLVGKRHVLVRDEQRPLRASPEAGAKPVALIDPGVILKVLECSGDWCRLEVQGYKGWMMKTEFWGVYAAEVLED